MPVDDGLTILMIIGLIELVDGKISVTEAGLKIIALCENEEPNLSVIRQILLPIIKKMTPAWITFAGRPLEERIIAIPERWREVLYKAELLSAPLSEEAQKWWDVLQEKVDDIERAYVKKIGDAGESLTITYEKRRLLIEEHSDLAERVRWISRESDYYGFDVESYRGRMEPSVLRPEDRIMIEVKSTNSDSEKSIRFILTRNEWETALANINCYYFYLWKNIAISSTSITGDGPIVLNVGFVQKYIPQDQHEMGKWMKCRIELNLNELTSYRKKV